MSIAVTLVTLLRIQPRENLEKDQIKNAEIVGDFRVGNPSSTSILRRSNNEIQISRCAAQLYASDYKVRAFIAKCLRVSLECKSSTAMTQHYALQYALCLQLGFGVPKHDAECSLLLEEAQISDVEFQTAVEDLRSKLTVRIYRESAYQKQLLDGYDLSSDLSLYYQRLDRLDEATTQSREDMSYLESFLGREHPLALSRRAEFCNLLLKMGRAAEALPLREEMVTMMSRTLGENNVNTIHAMLSLAAIFIKLDRLQEAESMLSRAQQSQLPNMEGSESSRMDFLRISALLRRAQERNEDAVKAQAELVHTLQKRLGSAHPEAIEEESHLCTFLIKQEKYEDAGIRLLRIVETCKNAFGEDSRLTLANISNLAYCYDHTGDFQASVDLYRVLVTKGARLADKALEHYAAKLKFALEQRAKRVGQGKQFLMPKSDFQFT